jgi:Ca-activated chloride channel family protein
MPMLLAQSDVLDEVVFGRMEHAWNLAFVALVVAAIYYGARARRLAMARLGRPELIARLVASVDHRKRAIKNVAIALATLLLVVATWRLQYGGVARAVRTSGLDIVVAVDYSKSMLAQDVHPNRSERLEAELSRFLEAAGRRGDRTGVVVFAGAARGLPLSEDTRLIRLYLERADPRLENPGGTAIGKALDLALNFLIDARAGAHEKAAQGSSGQADQVILLLTDGEDNASRPLELAKKAASLGVRIYTVGIGSTSGEPVVKYDESGKADGFQTDKDGNYIVTRLDAELLRTLAKNTGGEYVHVDSENFALDEVSTKIAGLSRAQRQDSVEIDREEGYVLLVAPALFLLCLALALGERKRRRTP